MNTHRAIVNRLHWMQQAYGLGAGDRVLQKTPFSFDVSVWEFFWPLMTGATLVMARPGGHRDPAYLCRIIAERGITTLHFVPSMLEAFVQEADATKCRLPPPGDLQRRGPVLRPAGAVLLAIRRRGAAQPLRADRGGGGRELLGLHPGRGGAGPADRPADRQPTALRARSPAGAGAGGGARRAVHRRRRAGAGLLAAPRPTAERFVPDPFAASPAAACTGPATWPAGGPTARSSTWGGSTTR